MSANLLVDLGGTCLTYPSIVVGGPLGTMSGQIGVASGLVFAASGGIVGLSVDCLQADTFTNILAVGQATTTSGQLRIQVQTSDTDVSGNYTDPTSGLAQLPTYFQSGGILILNSGGLLGGLLSTVVSGQAIQSGFAQAAGLQNPNRYIRTNVLSGDFYNGVLSVTIIKQLRTTGSGGGFTYAPGSGSVNV